MASALFHELYHRAFQLDCPTIHVLNRLTTTLGPGSTVTRSLLADRLVEAAMLFEEDLCEISIECDMRRWDAVEYRCPCCGLSHCSGAIQVTKIPPAALAGLKAMGLIP